VNKKVRDIMVNEVITIKGIATVREAMELMKDRRIKSLVVERRTPEDAYGIVTLLDIVKKVITHGKSLDMTNVCDIMSKPLITVSAGLQVKYAASLMSDFDVKRAVIIEKGELVGIVSMEDVVYSMLDDVAD